MSVALLRASLWALWLLLALEAGAALLGVRVTTPAAPVPDREPVLAEVLSAVVVGDRVAYRAFTPTRRATLEAWLRWHGVSRVAPSRAAAEARALNAYNAWVLFTALDGPPAASIRERRGAVEPRPGFGAFWGRWFRYDGRLTNLYRLEHETLRRGFGDARIHAAINCASRGCPSLSAEPFEAARLEAQLDAAARRFVNDPRHVTVDRVARRVTLSQLFQWYEGDFLAEAPSVLRWCMRYAEAPLAAALARAEAEGYAREMRPYDWRLNGLN
ncbi:MAG: DUF547 domain-containing protein [Myxococcales bacterium]|nr:DUF547 domain-containing protein [Myxococcales bacterium]